MLLQLFLRIIFSNTLTYDWNAWYRSWVKSQCMADEPHAVGISLKCSKNLFCGTCNDVWPKYRFFSTLFICQQLWGMWTVHLYIASIHICNLRWLYLSAYWYLHIFFVCLCFSSIVGVVIWHARWDLFCQGEAFHWYGSKIIFCSMFTSVSPKNIFFNIMNFVGIGSHMTFLFPCYYSIHFDIYIPISVYIFIFLHIFVWECLK